MLKLILIILFLLSKTQSYDIFLLSLYQQNTIKNYQNALAKYLKDQCFGKNLKQKVKIKIRQMSMDIFSNYTLYVLTDCLF